MTMPKTQHLPKRVTITVEVVRENGEGDSVEKQVFELDPEHTGYLFANGADQGWPSQFMGSIGNLPAVPPEKILTAHGYLVCNGLVTRKVEP